MNNIIRVTKENIIEMHRRLMEETGGGTGIRDEGLLESAVNAPYQTYMGDELYYGLFAQSAALGYYLISNHPFVDGNKRVGILAMLTLMEAESWSVEVESEEVSKLGWAIARGEMKHEHIVNWLKRNAKYSGK